LKTNLEFDNHLNTIMRQGGFDKSIKLRFERLTQYSLSHRLVYTWILQDVASRKPSMKKWWAANHLRSGDPQTIFEGVVNHETSINHLWRSEPQTIKCGNLSARLVDIKKVW